MGRGVTLTSEGVTTIEANGGAIFLSASTSINVNTSIWTPSIVTSTVNGYFGVDGELRLVNKGYADGSGGNPIYRYLRAQFVWADAIATNAGDNLYLGANSEVRATVRSSYNNSNPIYRNFRAAGLYADFLDSNTSTGGTHVYVRPQAGSEVRFTSVGGTTAYQSFRGLFGYMNAVDVNTGTHMYLRPASNGEVRVTATNTTDNWRAIRASEHLPPSSSRETKANIEVYNKEVLSTLRNANIYTYVYKWEEPGTPSRLGVMIDEMPRILHGQRGDSIELYAFASYLAKGVKELIGVTDNHADEINWLNIENQYLKDKVKNQEERISHLEDLLNVA